MPGGGPGHLFISYARADGRDFADRLKGDLEAAGHRVWMDVTDLELSRPWDVGIEEAIADARAFLAVMTESSRREGSVCRHEIQYARTLGKKIIPLRIDASVQTPLLLEGLTREDFTDDYKTALGELLQALATEEPAVAEPVGAVLPGVRAFDFGPEIDQHLFNFTGREWLAAELDGWLASSDARAFVILGEPGIGKSAIAAWLADRRYEQTIGLHFCTRRNTQTLDPHAFVAGLVAQLAERVPSYGDAVRDLEPGRRRDRASDAFTELIVEVLRKLPEPAETKLIIIDSLDEAAQREGETVLDVLADQAEYLPGWLRIVATTRPEEPILRRVRRLKAYELDAESSGNLDDVRGYVDARLARLQRPAADLVGQIADRAKGSFLYATLTVDALLDGALQPKDIGQMLPGLASYYDMAFARTFPDESAYARDFLPLLRALAIAYAPLPLGTIRALTGLSEADLWRRLRVLWPYLRTTGDGEGEAFALFHQSLRDWLTDPKEARAYWCEPIEGHRELSDALRGRELEPYALRYLPQHRVEAGLWDEVEALLTDLRFLEAKAEAGLIFDLAYDFTVAASRVPADRPWARNLRLIEQALRADLHFLARHPKTLLQCLWNSAWWYDCPEAARHYNPPERGWSADGPPWERPEPKLCTLLERWRAEKERRQPGFAWLRSLRPPLLALGSAQVACLTGHTKYVRSVAFSPNGRRVASGSGDGTVRVWDVAQGEERSCLKGHGGPVTSVAFSPDGRWIASASHDRTVRIRDTQRGEERACLEGHTRRVESVAFSPDGQSIASGSDDHTVRIWDAERAEERACLEGHTGFVMFVAFSGDGAWLASGSLDGTVRIWDVEQRQEPVCLIGHTDKVFSVAFSPDGRWVASGAADQTVRIWDAARRREHVCLRGHTGWVRAVAFAPEFPWVVSGSADRTIRLWNADSREEHVRFEGHARLVRSVAFARAAGQIASGSWDSTVRVWDMARREERRCLKGHTELVRSVAFSSDGHWMVSGANDRTVRLWDAENGEELGRLAGHENRVSSVAFSPDGRWIVSGSKDRTVRIWDARRRKESACFRGHTGAVTAVAFLVDGEWIASGATDHTVRIWDVRRREERACLRGHTDAVNAIALSGDGKWLASGARDCTVRIWDFRRQRESACLRGHTDPVSTVALSPDGRRVVSRSLGGTVRAWQRASDGSALEVDPGVDAEATAIGDAHRRWRATLRHTETVLEYARTGREVAWLPIVPLRISAHPDRPMWACGVGNAVAIFVLEGDPTD